MWWAGSCDLVGEVEGDGTLGPMMTTPGPATMPECYRHPGRETLIACRRCRRPICGDCMVDASVGFQCPSCVAATATPPPRAGFGGRRSGNPRTTSIVIVALNVLVWVAIMATGGAASPLVQHLGLSTLGRCFSAAEPGMWFPGAGEAACLANRSLWFPGVADGAWWQLLTSAFTHVAPWHLAFNMLAIWSLGPMLESILGRARYLALYFGSALVASTTVVWLSDPRVGTVGASGALFGLMAGLLVVAWKRGGDVRSILGWIGANALFTVLGIGFISWQGHLGGFVGGLAITAAIVFAKGKQRTTLQWAAVVGIVVACLALVALRVVTA